MKRLLICIILLSVSSSAFAQTYFQDPSADTLCPDDTIKVKLNPSFAFDSVQWQDSTSTGNANWTSVSFRSGHYKKTNDSIEVYGADSSYTIFLRALFDTTNNNAFDDTSTLKKIQLLSAFSWNDTIQGPQSVCSEDTATYRIDTTGTTIDSIKWDTAKTDAQVLAGYDSDSLQITTKPVKNDTIKAVVSGPCGRDSLAIKLNILDSLGATTISRPQTVCYNDSPKKVKLDSVPGDNRDSIVYTWLSAKGSNAFTTIQGANDTVYNPGRLKDTTRYSLRYKSAQGCGIDTTPSVQIGVYEDFSPGSIAIASGQEKDTICYNSKLDTNLYFNRKPSGAGDTFSYEWQRQTKGKSSWKTVGTNDTFYKPNKLKSTALYRVRVTAVSGCDSAFTDSVRIRVLDSLNSGVISGGQTICFNTRPDSIKFSQKSTGGGQNYQYQWQKDSLINGNWKNDTTTAGPTYQPTSLKDSLAYRVLVSTSDGCGPDTTNAVSINVYDSLAAGNLSGDTTICFNNRPGKIEAFNVEGGGSSYAYQWEIKQDQSGWRILSTSGTSTYAPSNLKDSSEYRSVITSNAGCGKDTTSKATIAVYDSFTTGSIATKTGFKRDTVCFGSATDTGLFFTEQSTGAGDTFHYEWQRQVVGNNSWKRVGKDTNVLKPSKLKRAALFRVKVSAITGCDSAFTDSVRIQVLDSLNSGVVGNDQVICFSQRPDTLKFTQDPKGGGNKFTYQWQKDQLSNGSWNDITSANAASYRPSNLRDTTSYRALVRTKAGCGPDTTNSVKIDVLDSFSVGPLTGDTTICYNDPPDTIEITNVEGGGDAFKYQWQTQNQQGVWNTVTTSKTGRYKPGQLKDSVEYRAVVSTDTTRCGVDTTNEIEIGVYNPIKSGSIKGKDSICFGGIPDTLRLKDSAQGGGGAFNYQWLAKSGASAYKPAPGTPNTKINYSPGNLTESSRYKLTFTSKAGCGVETSGSVEVTVFDKLAKPSIIGSDTICFKANPGKLLLKQSLSGGGGGYRYAWQDSVRGQSWSTNKTGDTFLNPDPLRTTTSYRLRVTSAFGCRQFSNESTVKVYDSLNSGQIIGDTTICFNTQPQTLKFGDTPSGGGDRYSYQWRRRSDQAPDYDSAGSGLAFQPSSQSDTNLYQVVVKSLEGCGFDTTNRVKVEVFPELRAPSITFSDQVSADTICQQEQPDSILVQQTTKGGAKPYSYSWQRQTDDDNQWEIESAQDKKQIKPGKLVDTATYRLSITSSRQCGTVVSDTLNTIVNPLPEPITLEGDQFICRNAKDKSYTFREPVNGHFYRWDIDGGEILEGRWSSNIIVDWSAQRSSDSLYLYDSITRTGCTRYSAFPITKSQFRAPDRTDVIRKPNSSILVAADSSEGLQYRWGFDFKNSDSSVVLDDADNRYAQFPEPFDSSRFDYWVKTFYTYNGDTCSTKTYLEPRQYSNIQIAGDQQSSIKVYPNPTKGQLTVEGTQLSRWQVKVLDQNGKPVDVSLIGDQIHFRSNLPEGLYLLYLKSDHNIITRKILLLK